MTDDITPERVRALLADIEPQWPEADDPIARRGANAELWELTPSIARAYLESAAEVASLQAERDRLRNRLASEKLAAASGVVSGLRAALHEALDGWERWERWGASIVGPGLVRDRVPDIERLRALAGKR
jgi:hypothetical protein